MWRHRNTLFNLRQHHGVSASCDVEVSWIWWSEGSVFPSAKVRNEHAIPRREAKGAVAATTPGGSLRSDLDKPGHLLSGRRKIDR